MPTNFENLEVWKECRILRRSISQLVKTFPSEEKFRLVDQLVRSSRSTTANIAEGHGRYHFQENIQFCRHTRGSLEEVLDHLICALDEEYITVSQLNDYRVQIEKCLKLLNGYIAYLQKQKENDKQK
ncbi:MAG: four helix bundle protein [Paludibacteraceae bacterium]|nr:four helix bundle protein [Paludibacteraceae bacterium]